MAGLPNQMFKINKGNNLEINCQEPVVETRTSVFCCLSSFLYSLFSSFYILVLVFCLQLPANCFQNNEDYDSIIVHPKKQLLRSQRLLNNLMYRSGVQTFARITDNAFVISLDESSGTKKEEVVASLRKSGLYDLVEPDYKFSLDEETEISRKYVRVKTHKNLDIANVTFDEKEAKEITPNDKGFSAQYYLKEINATKAWDTTLGEGLLVGVLDTGVDESHPDLTGKVIGGINLNNQDLRDEIGHGTEVSGIIAANTNNTQGIAGIGWNTKIVSMRVTDAAGQARVSTVVSALNEASKRGIKIVQLSLSTNQFSQTFKSAIEEAQSKGILIVSTGGNTGIEEVRYPAAFDGVIGVGAVDESKEREYYSTQGEHVSIVAPGASIYTTSLKDGYNSVSGTSFAAPQVAGAAALVWSVAPDLTNDQVRDILLQSADDLGDSGKDKDYGYGLLNIQKAVGLAKLSLGNTLEIKSWIKNFKE